MRVDERARRTRPQRITGPRRQLDDPMDHVRSELADNNERLYVGAWRQTALGSWSGSATGSRVATAAGGPAAGPSWASATAPALIPAER